jgi:hypothetical protein
MMRTFILFAAFSVMMAGPVLAAVDAPASKEK